MRAFRLSLIILFFVALAGFGFWVIFYSSLVGNSSTIYSLRSSYYSLTRKFTKPQVKDFMYDGIQLVDTKDDLYQYLFIGKYSYFDFDNRVIYLTSQTGKVHGFRLPVEADLEDKNAVTIGFIEIDEFGYYRSDDSGQPVKQFEPVRFDVDKDINLSPWLGKNVWIYWNDNRKRNEILGLSKVNKNILVNDPSTITEIIRSSPKSNK